MMPVLYLSHGAPSLADDPYWPAELATISAGLPEPSAVLIVSAHWEAAPLTLAATTTVPLFYDFWGFPERYYQVEYPAAGAPDLAVQIRKLIPGVYDDPARGLDHGAYVPLKEMYPAAEVPVLQVSMPTLDPVALLDLGRRLAPLRDQGVLIVGSGFTTHNLAGLDMREPADRPPPSWSAEFDDWASRTVESRDVDGLLDFLRKAPAAHLAHPRTEHFAPLFVSLGASLDSLDGTASVVEGFWHGLSKRSWQFN